MSMDIRWEERKKTNPMETMKSFCYLNEKELVPDIEEAIKEEKTPTPDP